MQLLAFVLLVAAAIGAEGQTFGTADGHLCQRCHRATALRITGTGATFKSTLDNFVARNASGAAPPVSIVIIDSFLDGRPNICMAGLVAAGATCGLTMNRTTFKDTIEVKGLSLSRVVSTKMRVSLFQFIACISSNATIHPLLSQRGCCR